MKNANHYELDYLIWEGANKSLISVGQLHDFLRKLIGLLYTEWYSNSVEHLRRSFLQK